MIPKISEHDTWISLDPVVGCPVDCIYCFVRRFEQTQTRPQARWTPEESIEGLREYLNRDPIVDRGARQTPRLVALGNYTDMFLTSPNRDYTLAYAKLHARAFPGIPLVLITKARLSDDTVSALDAIEHPILVFVSQSFFTNDSDSPAARMERGVATPSETCATLRLLSASRNLLPLHFWRPITRTNVPDAAAAYNQALQIQQAGAIASVAVGLKYGSFLRNEFGAPDHPLNDALTEKHVDETPSGEAFPTDLQHAVIEAGRQIGHPIYLNTSCAVSLALKQSEFLETWRPPVRQRRCLPAHCPKGQRDRCDSKLAEKAEAPPDVLSGIANALAIPRGCVRWDGVRDCITVDACLTQEMHSRLTHRAGRRIRPMALHGTLEWIGTLSGVGASEMQEGVPINPRKSWSECLPPLVARMKNITGMLTPVAPTGDERAALFSRHSHVRRVATVAGCLAQRLRESGYALDVDRSIRLAWLHDLNRWPFAHVSEAGHFNQGNDLRGYFKHHDVRLEERDIADLEHLHAKRPNDLTLDGRVTLAADWAAGMIEDIFLSISALGLSPDRVPEDVREVLGLELTSRTALDLLTRMRRRFVEAIELDRFHADLDSLVTGHSLSLISSTCDLNRDFALSPAFERGVHFVRWGFLQDFLFPLVNAKIGKSPELRATLVDPLLDRLGPSASARMAELDDAGAVELAIELAVITQGQWQELQPDYDYISREEPELAFRTD